VRGARWLALAARFAADQVRSPCDALLSFWGYPMGAYAVALGRLARKPTAVVLLGAETADLPAINYGHLGRRASRQRLLRACARADALVAVSRFQLDRLAAHDFRREDAHVVPLGAEPEMFPFAPKPPGMPLKIIHVSNLTEVKDQATLLRGFARLRGAIEARLRIVGADHMRGEMQRLARTLAIGDHLEFTGPVPYAEMPAHYRWADMAVLTSLSEGQNRGLTEAAMCGVLMVGTPVGHLYDLGEDAAVLVKTGDPEHLARRIQEIAADGAGWRRRVDAARAWAAAHDIEWTVARLGEIVDGLI
jgi:glycosyltransferase involved in cell wall biosynthesis